MLKTILYRLGITFALIALLGSCGNDSNVQPDGQLTTDITKFTYTHAGTAALPPPVGTGCSGIVGGVGVNTQDLLVRVLTIDANGNPAGKVDFNINASFAENVTSGTAVTALLINDVLVSGVGDPVPYTATTDSNGELYVTLRYDTTYDSTCVYTGSISLSSGIQNVLVTFEVANPT